MLLSRIQFVLHGGLFLYLKTEGDFQARLRDWMWRSWGLFLVLFMLATLYTVAEVPRATANFEAFPPLVGLAVISILAAANIPRCLYWNLPKQTFVSSTVVILSQVALFGAALFPNLVTASTRAGPTATPGPAGWPASCRDRSSKPGSVRGSRFSAGGSATSFGLRNE